MNPLDYREPTKSERIEGRIDQTCREVKRTDLFLTLTVLLTCTVGYLFVFALLDHWCFREGVSPGLRVALFLLGAVFALGYLGLRLTPLLRYSVNPVYAAKVLEGRRSSMKNALINWVLLRKEETAQANKPVSPLRSRIVEGLTSRAANDLDRISGETIVDHTPIIRWLIVLAVLTGLLCLYSLLSPKNPLTSFLRLTVPFAGIETPTRVRFLEISPGNAELFQGETTTITARIEGAGNDPVFVYYTTDDRRAVDQAVPMSIPEGGYKYECRFPPGKAGFEQGTSYQIGVGGERSRSYRFGVLPPQTLEVREVVYTFPEYTGQAPLTVPNTGDIRALEGTQVTIEAKANFPMSRAEFIPDNNDKKGKSMSLSPDARGGSVGLWLTTDPLDPSRGEFQSYVLRGYDSEGTANRRPSIYKIEVLRDQPPKVSWVEPPEEQFRIPLNGFADLKIEAEDADFGIRAIRLHFDAGEKKIPPLEVLAAGKEKLTGFSGVVNATGSIRPEQLRLEEGDAVECWAEAIDTKTPDGNSAVTKRLSFVVDPPKAGADRKDANQDKQEKKNQERKEEEKTDSGDNTEKQNPGEGNQKTLDDRGEESNDEKENGKDENADGRDSQEQGGQQSNNSARDNKDQGNKDQNNNDPNNQDQGDQENSNDQEKNGDENDQGNQDQGKQSDENKRQQNRQNEKQQDGGNQGNQPKDARQQQKQDDQAAPGSQNENDESSGGGSESGGKEQGGSGQPDSRQSGGGQQTGGSEGGDDSQDQNGGMSGTSSEPGKDSKRGGAGDQGDGAPDEGRPDEQSGGGKNQQNANGGKGESQKTPFDGDARPGEVFEKILEKMKEKGKDRPGADNGPGERSDELNPQSDRRSAEGTPPEKMPEHSAEKRPGEESQKVYQPTGEKGDDSKQRPKADPKTPIVGDPKNGTEAPDEQPPGGQQKEGSANAENPTDRNPNETPEGGRGEQQGAEQSGQPSQKGGEGGEPQGGAQAQPGAQPENQQGAQPGEGGASGGEGQPQSGAPAGPGEGAETGSGEGAPQGQPSGANDSKSSPGTPGGKPGNATGGGGGSDANSSSGSQSSGSHKSNPNKEFAEKQTALALKYLEEELAKKKPDPELWEQFGWTKDDLRAFAEKWRKMSKDANTATPGSREDKDWQEALQSMGPLQSGRSTTVQAREGFRDRATATGAQRVKPPRNIEDRARAYDEGIAK